MSASMTHIPKSASVFLGKSTDFAREPHRKNFVQNVRSLRTSQRQRRVTMDDISNKRGHFGKHSLPIATIHTMSYGKAIAHFERARKPFTQTRYQIARTLTPRCAKNPPTQTPRSPLKPPPSPSHPPPTTPTHPDTPATP